MSKKLTVTKIKKIIAEERKKLEAEGWISPKTVDNAWSGGDNLVKAIDYVKELGIKEAKLRKKADLYSEQRKKIKLKILKDL